MAVTAALVKELRELTGSGMMDCKKALVETDGDIDKAVDWLREKGIMKAQKKSGRIAAEGLVRIAFGEGNKVAAIAEVNSETDFVSKNEEFVEFVEAIAAEALVKGDLDMDVFLEEPFQGATVKEVLTAKVAKIGENLNIRRYTRVEEDGVVYTGYIHGGGRIGVVIGIKTDATPAEVEACGRDVAMQVASMNPTYVSRNEMPQDVVAHEREVQEGIMANDPSLANKPEKVKAGIIEGRVSKSLQDMCLVDQEYFLDSSLKCGQYLKENNAEVVKFVKYIVGEGIEKKQDDFAAEVAAMAK